ncbi:MAG: NAD-dependent epimerase/dehydratase family protein [Verrucomicrobiota bacterium]
MDNPLKADLDHILEHTQGLWDELRGRRLFITGGTGFFGCWLLESLAWANDKLGLNVQALVLTRNPDAFARKAPHLANHPAINFHVGDVRNFVFPEGPFSHVIHAATEASAKLNAENPLLMFNTIVEGTRRTLDFAVQTNAKKILLASSGAVYGRQPPELTHIPEDYNGSSDPLDPKSAYGAGKRAAEMLCCLYAQQHGLEPKIARCFAFVGPYLPLDAHFAIGNFIRDALRGGPIQVKGDGTPYRSYLYAADLAIWLWTILLRGQAERAYNIGSEEALAISEVARVVGTMFNPPVAVHIIGKPVLGKIPERYVPSTRIAWETMKLQKHIDLPDAIRRTTQWCQQKTIE